MSTSEITHTRSDFLAAGLALDAAMEANGRLVDILSEVYQVFFNHVVEVRVGLTTDVTTWLDGHVPEDIKTHRSSSTSRTRTGLPAYQATRCQQSRCQQ
jgi:hypothetical protein